MWSQCFRSNRKQKMSCDVWNVTDLGDYIKTMALGVLFVGVFGVFVAAENS